MVTQASTNWVVAARQPAHHPIHHLQSYKTNGQQGTSFPVKTTMTETGKAFAPRASDLTENATALCQRQGNPHDPPCGNEWCPTPERCDRAYHTRYLALAERAVAYHTEHHNLTALGYAVRWLPVHQGAIEAHDRACEARERAHVERTNRANAKSKLGPWEFTLTYSPAKHGWSHDEAKENMRAAMERLTRYYREEIEELHATGEYTQAGAPHVHCWYRLTGGRKITTKSFKRAYPIWNPKVKTGPRGHEGGHHEPVKRTSDFAGYVEKHLETSWLNYDITNATDVSQEADRASDDHPSDHTPPDSPRTEGERT